MDLFHEQVRDYFFNHAHDISLASSKNFYGLICSNAELLCLGEIPHVEIDE